jgi:protein TonB
VIENNIFRWISSIIISLLITLALFWSMQKMISRTNKATDTKEDYKTIEFVQANLKETKPEIKKELPPEPKPKEKPPEMVEKVVSQTTQTSTPQRPVSLNMDMPSVGKGIKVSQGRPQLLGPVKMAKMDSELTPMLQIRPIYPSRARMMGTEGHVTVRLEVNESGEVTKVTIVNSIPKGVFDSAVRRAVKRWKFRPKTVDGKAVEQSGVLTINFSLDQE